MDSRDCFKELPIFYRLAMHYSHIFTVPFYTAVLIVLYRESSKTFRTYKYYIIAHVLINIVSEMYVCYFVLPDTHLPHPLLRMTGFLAEWGFSGILIFHIMAQTVIWTGGSILEMFYYRFKICVFNYQSYRISKLFQFIAVLYRIGMFVHPVVAGVTLQQSLLEEEEGRMKLWQSNTSFIPIEVTCYSVMLALPRSFILWIFMFIYTIMTGSAVISSLSTVFFITRFIKKSRVMSKTTEMLQRMLIFSLVIQALIHGAMIMTPILVLIYAGFFQLSSNVFARFFLMVFAYHGFCSTFAMVLFTKPLRDKIMPFFKHAKLTRTAPISTVQPSATE